VEDRFAGVFEGNPDADEILSSPGKFRPAAVLNLHGGTRSMALTMASRAPIRAGFAHHAYSLLYTDRLPPAHQVLGQHRTVHTAEHIASAMFWMGVPQSKIPRARLVAGGRPSRPGYAVIHPFASKPEKTWTAPGFLAIANHVKNQAGLDPVFLAGPQDDPSQF